jgi:hypothetical protein
MDMVDNIKLTLRDVGREMGGTSLGLCSEVGFGVSGIQPSGSIAIKKLSSLLRSQASAGSELMPPN